jgi:RNA polymerase sigma-70 factor (ECF subfamily)
VTRSAPLAAHRQIPGEGDHVPHAIDCAGMAAERSNEEWVKVLGQRSPETDAAHADLRAFLVRGLHRALRGRPAALPLTEDFAQEALLRIARDLGQFRGESKFTTWALAIAIRVAFNELRRTRWRDVSLDDLMDAQGFTVTETALDDPARSLSRKQVLEILESALDELTVKQRHVLVAELRGVPQEVLASRMGMSRNALYKLGHDGRKRMKQTLLASGWSWTELERALRPEGG